MRCLAAMFLSVAALSLSSSMCLADTDLAGDDGRAEYRSPYSVSLPWPVGELIPDLLEGERGDPRREAVLPHDLWYQHRDPWVGPWGPLPRHYDWPGIADGKSDDWKRARVIAAALRYLGYQYRHHYIPDWNPPIGWYVPKPGGTRHDGKGVDCSNFTSFVYNQALGFGISSDVHKQAVTESVTIYGTNSNLPVTLIEKPQALEKWAEILKPGDLLFIRPKNGNEISHVVIWVGVWGASKDGLPLVLDSHGADVRDSEGALIPSGIYLRPFRQNSWYATNADHAIRIIGR